MASKSIWLEILKPFPEINIGDDRIKVSGSASKFYFDFQFSGQSRCILVQLGDDIPIDATPAVIELWYDTRALWWLEAQVCKGTLVHTDTYSSEERVKTERCFIFPWEHLISVTRVEVKEWDRWKDDY